MVTKVVLTKLTGHAKKYKVVIVRAGKRKTVYFGASGYSDFTMHGDIERRERYLKRHANEDWTNLDMAGTWSRYLLWNKPTLNGSKRHMASVFGITFIKKL